MGPNMNNQEDDCSKKSITKRIEKLKRNLEEHYSTKLLILRTKYHGDSVIVNSSNLEKKIVNTRQEECISAAANYIKADIEEHSKLSENPLSWSPSIDELLTTNQNLPPSLALFMTPILKSKNHGVATPRIQGFIDSFSSDLFHGVSKGKVMTPKHYLLGLGLHNITGQKKVVQIVNRLGHSISYDEVLDIETAQAKRSRETIERGESSILPIIPKSDGNQVSTVFWVDNFDKKLDTERGGGAINITTMMAFQETSEGSVKTENDDVRIERNRDRIISSIIPDSKTTIDNKQEPYFLSFDLPSSCTTSNLIETLFYQLEIS